MNVSVQPEPSGPYANSLFWICVVLSMLGQQAFASSLLERAEAMDPGDSEPAFVLRLKLARGVLCLREALLAKGLTLRSQARTLAHRTGDIAGQGMAAMACAGVYQQVGDLEGAEAAADEMEFSESTAWSDYITLGAAIARATTRGPQGALEAIATFRVLVGRPDAILASVARGHLAFALLATGDLDGAEREATALGQGFALPEILAGALGALARVALHRGESAHALALAERSLDVATSGARGPLTDSILYLARAEALHAVGRTQDAHAAIREARDRILDIEASFVDAGLPSYLTNVDANARTLKLAREWLGDEAATT